MFNCVRKLSSDLHNITKNVSKYFINSYKLNAHFANISTTGSSRINRPIHVSPVTEITGQRMSTKPVSDGGDITDMMVNTESTCETCCTGQLSMEGSHATEEQKTPSKEKSVHAESQNTNICGDGSIGRTESVEIPLDDRIQITGNSTGPLHGADEIDRDRASLQAPVHVDAHYSNADKETPSKLSNRALKRLRRDALRKETHKNNSEKSPGFGEDMFQESDFYFENGLRKVYPYFFTFKTYAKERWFGKTVVEIFSKEFKTDDFEHTVEEIIELGGILINGQKTDVNYVLKNGDILEHTVHRHENPVLDTPLEIISNNEDMIVLNKPSSIPCHPCGRYRFNSVVFILGKEYGCSNLRTIYRLDRLTSGVLIFGKTDKKSKELEKQVAAREVKKEYICRVCGKFPDGMVEVNRPLGCMSHKLAVWRVDPAGKASTTKFERLSYNGKSSVVKCYPLTGRTHQIRVHLQYLGHPIINDPVYNSTAFGPEKGKNGAFGASLEDICNNIMKEHNTGLWLDKDGENPLYASRLAELKTEREAAQKSESDTSTKQISGTIRNHSEVVELNTNEHVSNSTGDDTDEPVRKKMKQDNDSNMNESVSDKLKLGFDSSKWIPSENCPSCRQKFIDPTRKELTMFLHALKYKGPNWEYSTQLPKWAVEDWHGDEEN